MVIGFLIVGIIGVGCARTVANRIIVRDAETDEAVSGAEVRVGYPYCLFCPHARGMTDSSGAVVLRVTADRRADIYPSWHIDHPDYFANADGREVWATIDQIEAAIRTGQTDETIELVLKRWHRPEPTVVVRIPDGYFGYVRVCPDKDLGYVGPGHPRYFECEADELGVAMCPAGRILTLFTRPSEPRYEFRWSSGTPIPRAQRVPSGEDTSTLVWGMGPVSGGEAFLVADEATAASERRKRYPNGLLDSNAERQFIVRVMRGPLRGETGSP
jgi:hypothetical protein